MCCGRFISTKRILNFFCRGGRAFCQFVVTVCVQFVYSLCTVCVHFVYILCTVCVHFVYSLCTFCVQFVYSLCTVCVQFAVVVLFYYQTVL